MASSASSSSVSVPRGLLLPLVVLLSSLLLFSARPAEADPGCAVYGTALDSALTDLQWFGEGGQTVFALTDQRNIYRSTNEGKTFSNEMSKLANATRRYAPYYLNGVRAIYPSKDPRKIWILGFGPALWTTSDGGATYQYIDTGRIIHDLAIHPTIPDVALAGAWTAPCYPQLGAKGDCVHELYVTFDFGKTWSLVDTYISTWTWGLIPANATDPNVASVFYNAFPDKRGDQRTRSVLDLVLIHTTRYGKDKKTLMQTAIGLLYMPAPDDILWVATYEADHRSLNLYVSQDDGKTLTDTDFPEGLVEKRYTILDASEKSAFVNVDHSPTGTWGMLYMSDDVDLKYSTSLDKQRRGPYAVDFVRFEGLDGIYMSNYYDDSSDTPSERKIKTVITYDKGGNWQQLPQPTNEACKGGGNCSLNLFGPVDSTFGRFYTEDTAVGLVLSTGNVGPYLRRASDDVNTYFSRDAGWTWTEISTESCTYEFGDHGGIIVMGWNQKRITNVSFTWNQGLSWTECPISSTPFSLANIMVEPSSVSSNFIAYGTFPNNTAGLFFLDFTTSRPRDCQGASSPGSPDSDYELWSPTDVLGQSCLLGQTITYVRRKQSSQCYNGLKFETSQKTQICPCTDEDYECDYCFEPGEDGVTCVPSCADYDYTAAPKNCHGTYTVTSGYRKVPGDVCDDTKGVNKLGTQEKCPSGPTALYVLIVLTVLIAGVGAVLWYLHTHNDRFRDYVKTHLPAWASFGGNSRGGGYSRVNLGDGDSNVLDDYESDAELLDEEELSGGLSSSQGESSSTRATEENAPPSPVLSGDALVSFPSLSSTSPTSSTPDPLL